ncbi:uncharacterized protein K460DRAFT_131539 [Cucurbitaria berberidis CBS 394.84]|uniref:Uncharacterized protein n=1 Tax=Cucurbitaria berberidis CBS 394.84 TaxID=1168544 RepID=A0A9P4GKE3_9PLEO|nr:uncharacterized protein K460DRAFT_131539 [Cucurbitaria berberidis CBS 394.84]KAF1846819.1 hypothetical protein K460DRAFT_131539 [Cucurbitaria berberidis CBS 394.84]
MYVTHGKQFLGSMSGLARSLVTDLRLVQKPSKCPSIGPQGPQLDNIGIQTQEASRALLAVFGLSAIISTTLKYDCLPWSSQIEEACDKLTRNAEDEGDRILVATARIARICVNAAEVARRALEDPNYTNHVIPTIGPLKTCLDSARSTLTAEQLGHNTIIAFLYSAEITIYELTLLQHPPTYQNPSDYRRIEYLTSCLQSCKSVIENYLLSDIAHITGSAMLIVSYSVKVLYKLSTLNHDPGWDSRAVRETVDIVSFLEQLAAVAERENARFKEQTGEDCVLAAAAEAIRRTAPIWRVEDQDMALDGTAAAAEWNGADSSMDFFDSF